MGFWDSNSFRQQPDRLHEIFIVQKGLTHSHKDNIQPVLRRIDILVVEHSTDLPHNLAGGQIAFYAEQSCQTEPTIHRTTDLTGHTNCSSVPASSFTHDGFDASLAPVPYVCAVSLRHPDGFDALTIGEFNQITGSPVLRDKFLVNFGESDRKPQLLHFMTELVRKRRDQLN